MLDLFYFTFIQIKTTGYIVEKIQSYQKVENITLMYVEKLYEISVRIKYSFFNNY